MRDNIKGGALTESTLLILLSVYNNPNHGYGIMQFIEQKTSGRVILGAGTLYGALNTLVDKGNIIPFSAQGAKKEYLITDSGKQLVFQELQRLEQMQKILLEIVGGKINDKN